MADVFLVGTCNDSTWRERLKPLFDGFGLSYFDPVVPNGTPECQARELQERETAKVCLYVITPPMTDVDSIAEVIADVVDDSNKRPDRTVFCVLSEDGDKSFDDHQMKSLRSVMDIVERNGCLVARDLDVAADGCVAVFYRKYKVL
jgi:hypothetical protein